jgi:hypothetical protein
MIPLLRSAFTCTALLVSGLLAEAHEAAIQHHPHATEPHKPHEAPARHPHAAASHPRPQQPPKHANAHYAQAPKVPKH